MDEDDDLPNIDLNPSGSDTISSAGDEGSSSNGSPVSADSNKLQSEETGNSAVDDDDDDDDESTLPSGYQGKDAPSIKWEKSAC